MGIVMVVSRDARNVSTTVPRHDWTPALTAAIGMPALTSAWSRADPRDATRPRSAGPPRAESSRESRAIALGLLRRSDAVRHEHLLLGAVLRLQVRARDLEQPRDELVDRRLDAHADVEQLVGRVGFQREDVRTCDVVDVNEVVRLRPVAEDHGPLAGVDSVEHLHDHAHVRPQVVHPRAVDVHVAQPDPVETVLLVERAEELLAGDLRRSVHRPVVERMLLGHRDRDGVSVHRSRGGEDHLAHTGVARGLGDVVRAAHVDLERLPRLVDALVQPERSEVKDVVARLHQRPDELDIRDRAFDHAQPRIGRCALRGLRGCRGRSCRARRSRAPASRAVARRRASR